MQPHSPSHGRQPKGKGWVVVGVVLVMVSAYRQVGRALYVRSGDLLVNSGESA